jgi:DNA-directed RNA polymerase specialized sigma24 family protein
MSMGGIDSDLEELYRRRQVAFQVMLASVTGSVESARDVVQEAFAQALRYQDGFRGDGSLEAWVWRIAFRVAIGSKGSRELSVDEVPDVAFVDTDADPTLAAPVRELPPQRRMAIFLRYFADLSYAASRASRREGCGPRSITRADQLLVWSSICKSSCAASSTSL